MIVASIWRSVVGADTATSLDRTPSRVTADSVTVLFDDVGFKTLDLALVTERQLLEPVGSASSDT